jgi:hypothetical protein
VGIIVKGKVLVKFTVDRKKYRCEPSDIVSKVGNNLYLVKWEDDQTYKAIILEGAEFIGEYNYVLMIRVFHIT